MRTDCILGLDIGTQSVKGVLVDRAGAVLAHAALDRSPQYPQPGWVEMEVERDWWGAALQVIRRLLVLMPAQYRPAAVGICGLVPCMGLLDNKGLSVAPAILYSDNRALEELKWVNDRAGLQLNAQAVLPKLVWMKRHQPSLFSKARILLSAHNYLVYRLTGKACMDYDTASIMGGVFDPVQKYWKTGTLNALELPFDLWPAPVPADAVAGTVTRAAAQATGLPAGIPVIGGSGDTFPTMLGCGAINPGDAMVSIGTTGLLTITTRPLVESLAGPHFCDDRDQGGTVIWGANVLSAGRLVTWFCDQFAGLERQMASRLAVSELDLLEQQAACIPAGSGGLIMLPHLLGRRTPYPDANLKGAILGLGPNHTLAHIYRAILESFAYNINQGFLPLRQQIKRLVVTAGGARSRLWRSIIADVLNIPLEYHEKSSGSLGIAFITAYGTGIVSDFGDIRNVWLTNPEVIVPDSERAERYQQYFQVYDAFDRVVAGPYADLADIERSRSNQPDNY
jgi:xylulokinase